MEVTVVTSVGLPPDRQKLRLITSIGYGQLMKVSANVKYIMLKSCILIIVISE
jgi:hypothetical protein